MSCRKRLSRSNRSSTCEGVSPQEKEDEDEDEERCDDRICSKASRTPQPMPLASLLNMKKRERGQRERRKTLQSVKEHKRKVKEEEEGRTCLPTDIDYGVLFHPQSEYLSAVVQQFILHIDLPTSW